GPGQQSSSFPLAMSLRRRSQPSPTTPFIANFGWAAVRQVALYAPSSVTPGYYYRSLGGTSTSQEVVA
ncbi:MAG TPA: hypothetical protein VF772_11480, partial [Terriglobales bacterium]